MSTIAKITLRFLGFASPVMAFFAWTSGNQWAAISLLISAGLSILVLRLTAHWR